MRSDPASKGQIWPWGAEERVLLLNLYLSSSSFSLPFFHFFPLIYLIFSCGFTPSNFSCSVSFFTVFFFFSSYSCVLILLIWYNTSPFLSLWLTSPQCLEDACLLRGGWLLAQRQSQNMGWVIYCCWHPVTVGTGSSSSPHDRDAGTRPVTDGNSGVSSPRLSCFFIITAVMQHQCALAGMCVSLYDFYNSLWRLQLVCT